MWSKPPKEKKPSRHPGQDRTNRHPLDVLLRSHGWRIHARPRKGQPLWQKDGEVLTEDEVLGRLDVNEVEDARYLERLDKEGME